MYNRISLGIQRSSILGALFFSDLLTGDKLPFGQLLFCCKTPWQKCWEDEWATVHVAITLITGINWIQPYKILVKICSILAIWHSSTQITAAIALVMASNCWDDWRIGDSGRSTVIRAPGRADVQSIFLSLP